MRRHAGLIASWMAVAALLIAPTAAGAHVDAPTAAGAHAGAPTAAATHATHVGDRRPGAVAASAPTLGLRTDRFTEGFGRVRPWVVSYGGDPTSLLTGVHWRSWGRARAVGHGTADWVWPGWCVACGSVQLRATVVAFGLATCAGHPAYTHVEWYFPSRGMTFSRRLSLENLCHPRRSAPAPQPRQEHCASVSIPGGRVERIQALGEGVRCPGVRRLVTRLPLLRHLGHNARFHVGRWWCGSELTMQPGRVPPQSFSCEMGDDNLVWFSVRRRG